MAVAKVISKVLRHEAGLIIKNAFNFRNYTTPRLRCVSSTFGTPNNSTHSNTESGGKKFPKRFSNIQWEKLISLCKAESGREPYGVHKLFHDILKLPHEIASKQLDSALYWFSYYDKIEEAFQLKSLMDKHGVSKTSSTYYVSAHLYSKAGKLATSEQYFDEMIRNGVTPHARHYVPFFETALEKGDLLSAFDVLYRMQNFKSGVLHKRGTALYTTLIRACLGSEDEQITRKVLELFNDFRKNQDLLSNDTLEAVKLWFDSQANTKWVTSWSSTSPLYHCEVCQRKLETGEFLATELEQLKLDLVLHLWKQRKDVTEVRCYTSSGNYIDHIRRGKDDLFPSSLDVFIKATGPYDIVLDGLNIGFYGGGFEPSKVQKVAAHFLQQNKKVLVVCSRPMEMNVRNRQPGFKKKIGALMDYLEEYCGVFCVADGSLDDLYFLSATMHCGPAARLVSSDKFGNHLDGANHAMRSQFRRWSKLNQIHLLGFANGNPEFQDLPSFDAVVQTTGDTWHFPSGDGNQLLCVRKAQQDIQDQNVVSP